MAIVERTQRSSRVTPDQFITKWKAAELKERSAAQSHFIDLCRLLDEPAPTDVDPKGDWYAFERGATKTTGGEGWADVWKRDHFGWEYKGKRKDLNAAFAQLQQYALALENPPLLVVCDFDPPRFTTSASTICATPRRKRLPLSLSAVGIENRDGESPAALQCCQLKRAIFRKPAQRVNKLLIQRCAGCSTKRHIAQERIATPVRISATQKAASVETTSPE